MNDEQELYHFGILGMKWGIRRYQNEDGSYTEEGKRRKSKGRDYDPDYWKAHDKKKPEYMSDRELQQRITRLNNEKQYEQLTKSKGRKAADAVAKKGSQFVNQVVDKAVIGVAAGLIIKASKDHAPEIINAGKEFLKNALDWQQYLTW